MPTAWTPKDRELEPQIDAAAAPCTPVLTPTSGDRAARRVRVLMAVAASDEVGGLETSFARILPELRKQGAECSVLICGPDAAGSGSESYFAPLMPTHPVRSMRAAGALMRGFDVVHLHGSAGTILWPAAVVAACKASRTPLVVTLHLPSLPPLPARLHSALRNKLNRLPREVLLTSVAKVIGAPTEAAAAIAATRLAPLRARVIALDNGVPDPGVRPMPAGPLRVVFLGRLADQKRPDLFIAAIERAVAGGGDLYADVVGDGPLRGQVADRIASSPARDRFVLHGFLADPQPVLAAGHVLSLTSAAEGGPMVAMEAAALGRGIVARDGVPGLGSEWGGGVLRVLTSAGAEVSAFADAFRVLAADPAVTRRLGEDARHRYESHHTAEHAAARLLAAYADATGSLR